MRKPEYDDVGETEVGVPPGELPGKHNPSRPEPANPPNKK
jgi:hypothetical protein